jgi:hypothetical protein
MVRLPVLMMKEQFQIPLRIVANRRLGIAAASLTASYWGRTGGVP